jgi:Xaa-Pro aminopeptidase
METTAILARRRTGLARAADTPILLYAGTSSPRNYAQNTWPFRASSHFLYAVGESVPGGWIIFDTDVATLFVDYPDRDDALWHGISETPEALGARLGLEVRPTSELEAAAFGIGAATMAPARGADCARLSEVLQRTIRIGRTSLQDEALTAAMITARLVHDELAVAQLRVAADVAAEAFAAGRAHTRAEVSEAAVRGRMVARVIERGMTTSFNPIVSVAGEVLHNEHSRNTMRDGDLLLVDFGAETPTGWASDVTRTWPVSGSFSATQRDLYQLVLDAQLAAIEAVAPGVRYRDVHFTAARVMTQGLVDLGILRGDVDTMVEDGVHAIFFPHGIGHLIGLDVHDMEDLGDRASYAPGRTRSKQFGTAYLRLDRDLEPGMAVTIEPGFYQVPAILSDSTLMELAGDRLDHARLAAFADVRGIRIEDDVLVTETGFEVLTASIPKATAAVESA